MKADEGLRAVQRGPLVYCAEQIDNADGFEQIKLCDNMQWAVQESPLMGGIRTLRTKSENAMTLIPYYSWDNREACEMKVWMEYEQ